MTGTALGRTAVRPSILLSGLHRAQVHLQPLALPAVVPRGPTCPASISSSCQPWPCQTLRQERKVAAAAAGAAAMPADENYAGGSQAAPFDLGARVRAICFFAWSLLWALPLFVSMLIMAPFVWLFDKYRRLGQHFVNDIWARISTSVFYPIEVVGKEHLPDASQPVVYVSNHQSFMDIYSLFHLHRHFKFISKTSNFLIPVVGWSMFLTGHVMLNRVDRRSQLKCLQQCRDLLAKGASVLFFPEGTRSKDRVLGGFKKGAFSVAVKSGVDVVPITLIGTGDLMPSGRELEMFSGKVKIVVHPRISTVGRDAASVTLQARQVIASALPAHLVGDSSKMLED